MKKNWHLYAHHIIDCIKLKIIDQHLPALEAAVIDMLKI